MKLMHSAIRVRSNKKESETPSIFDLSLLASSKHAERGFLHIPSKRSNPGFSVDS